MEFMKRLVCLLLCSSGLLAAELSGVHVVYLFPMAHGMDQYLANRLTNDHVLQVVTDPKLADAFFSDRVGLALQNQIETALAKPAPKDAPKDGKDAPRTTKSNPALAFGDTANKLDNPANNGSWSRGKGNVFLVDSKSRMVVWSTFDLPKNATDKELDHIASDIVNRLKKDLAPAQK
jgi:hypothetical protein